MDISTIENRLKLYRAMRETHDLLDKWDSESEDQMVSKIADLVLDEDLDRNHAGNYIVDHCFTMGLCLSARTLGGLDKIRFGRRDLPELWKQKPNPTRDDVWWWEEGHHGIRVDALDKAIALAESKIKS